MSSITEVSHHIKVVEDTEKITRAMYMIASSKMKRAVRLHAQNLKYFERVRSNIKFIMDNSGQGFNNPYYRFHPARKAGFVIIAGDKGLCGGYNGEILKLADTALADERFTAEYLFTVGNIASDYFARTDLPVNQTYRYILHDPNLDNARLLTYDICGRFRSKELDEVYVLYTYLDSKSAPRPSLLRMLPVLPEDFADAAELHAHTGNLVYHPNIEVALEAMVPNYLIGLIYSALVQSHASEHYSRMAAMDASNRNAEDMLAKLKIERNHARQAVITREISEIVSGGETICME
jgi:F-type H+-transporting ATPase subunit gamma